jgi:hypothetical protein
MVIKYYDIAYNFVGQAAAAKSLQGSLCNSLSISNGLKAEAWDQILVQIPCDQFLSTRETRKTEF